MFTLPPDAILATEISLSEDNILPMLKQAIPAFTKGFASATGDEAEIVKKLKLDDLYDAMKQVKAIRVDIFKMKKAKDAATMLNSFAIQVPLSKGWDRMMYDSSSLSGEILAVYARHQEYLGVMLSSDPKGSSDCVAVGMAGFVDLAKVAGWAGNLVATLSSSRHSGNSSGVAGKDGLGVEVARSALVEAVKGQSTAEAGLDKAKVVLASAQAAYDKVLAKASASNSSEDKDRLSVAKETLDEAIADEKSAEKDLKEAQADLQNAQRVFDGVVKESVKSAVPQSMPTPPVAPELPSPPAAH